MTAFENDQSRTGGRWTKEQHEKFLYGLKLYGKNWKKIQDLIQTRTSTQIRSHAQKFFIKMRKQQKSEDDSEIHQNSSQSKFAQETHISPNESKLLEKEKQVFSFYFEKIAKNFQICQTKGAQFNFWDLLVEYRTQPKYKSCEQLQIPHQFELDLKKSNSWNQKEKMIQRTSCQLIRTQFSCFQTYQSDKN